MTTPVRMTNLITGEVLEFANLNLAAAATPFKRHLIGDAARGKTTLPGYRVERILKKRRIKNPISGKEGYVALRLPTDLFNLVCEQAAREGMTRTTAFRLLMERAIKEHFVIEGVFTQSPISAPYRVGDPIPKGPAAIVKPLDPSGE
jgi:hypothetical protein